ncbi:MAG TPA: hypothetical protein PK370_02145 [Candidatus Woesebacteria bacterium]|nr:hypothetical protein [Candidatus Woesebacteria bacterium]HPJ16896.1 hypothetical protein [Candidatus Woesebacteria bacterium]
MNTKLYLPLVILSVFLLSGCGSKKNTASFSNPEFEKEEPIENVETYSDKYATSKIDISQTKKLKEEFKVKYKTVDPAGEGLAEFKAVSFKPITSAGNVGPDSGKKLYLLELSIKGNSKNKGQPATFNQIGDTPSPQFVVVDKSKNISYVEETYFSDAYTQSKKLFELSKITLDGDQWVTTAVVFSIPQDLNPDLAFRFINMDNKAEFYDISE